MQTVDDTVVTVRAVAGILRRDEKILIAERPAGKPYSGYWEFPGGKIESRETGFDTLKRELHEEIGIQVLSAELWFEHSHAYPDKRVYLEMWLVTAFDGEPHSKENQRLQWAALDEIMTLKLLEGNRAILEKISELFLL